MKKRRAAAGLLIGGGIASVGLVWYASRRSTSTTNAIERAIAGKGPMSEGGATVKLRLTGYWPFTAREDERRMEGGLTDRRGKPLYTLEMHLADPVKAPYVSLSGDDAIWPYGQRIVIPNWPGAVFRVVDTGGHFRGAGKIYRVMGYEPIDVCVDSSKTVVPKLVDAQIIPGDNFEHGAAVAVGKFKGQTVLGLDDATENENTLLAECEPDQSEEE